MNLKPATYSLSVATRTYTGLGIFDIIADGSTVATIDGYGKDVFELDSSNITVTYEAQATTLFRIT